jgi:hypothetical protein
VVHFTLLNVEAQLESNPVKAVQQDCLPLCLLQILRLCLLRGLLRAKHELKSAVSGLEIIGDIEGDFTKQPEELALIETK